MQPQAIAFDSRDRFGRLREDEPSRVEVTSRGTNVIGNKPQYAVSRDGRFLLNSVVESASTPIVIAANWMTLTRAQLDDLANDLSRAR